MSNVSIAKYIMTDTACNLLMPDAHIVTPNAKNRGVNRKPECLIFIICVYTFDEEIEKD